METTEVPLSKEKYVTGLNEWVQNEKAAIELIHIIGTLWYDRSVELIIFRNQLVDRSASQILALHQYAKEIVKKPFIISLNVVDGELKIII